MPERLRIALLDDYHDHAKDYLSSLMSKADITIFHDTILAAVNEEALVKRLLPFQVILTMRERTPLNEQTLRQLPNLKIILTTGMANRGIDMEWCKAHSIIVAGAPAASLYGVDPAATVQHTWALILALVDNIPRDQALITNPVQPSPPGTGHHPASWACKSPMNTLLPGTTLGVLGLGKLGLGTAKIALAFGMKIIAWSPNLTQARADDEAEKAALAKGTFRVVDKATLFETADIVSVHMILADSTVGIVQAEDLARMKKTSFFVNTSRGPLVNEEALLECLEKGRIRGAALDVFDIEPLLSASRWRSIPWGENGTSQVVMTPHTGYSFEPTFKEWWEVTRDNLGRIIDGKEPEHRIV